MTFFQNLIAFFTAYVRTFVVPFIAEAMELIVPVGATTTGISFEEPVVLRAMLAHNAVVRKARQYSWITQLYRSYFGGRKKSPKSADHNHIVVRTLTRHLTLIARPVQALLLGLVFAIAVMALLAQASLITTPLFMSIPMITVRKHIKDFDLDTVKRSFMDPEVNKENGKYYRSPMFRDIGRYQMFKMMGLPAIMPSARSIVRRLVYQSHAATVVTAALNDLGNFVFETEEGHTRGRLPGILRIRFGNTTTVVKNPDGTARKERHSVALKIHQDPSGQIHRTPRALPQVIDVRIEGQDDVEEVQGRLVTADVDTAYYILDNAPGYVKTAVAAWTATKNAAKITDLKVLLKRPGFAVQAINGLAVDTTEEEHKIVATMISDETEVDINDQGRWVVTEEIFNKIASEINLLKAGYSPLQATVVFASGAFFKGIIETDVMSGQALGFYGGVKSPVMDKTSRATDDTVVFASVMSVPGATPWTASIASQTVAYLDKQMTEKVFAPIGQVITSAEAKAFAQATSGLFGNAFNASTQIVASSAKLFRKANVQGLAGQFGVRAGRSDVQFFIVTSDVKRVLSAFGKITWIDREEMIFECAAVTNPALPVNDELDIVRVQIIEDDRVLDYYIALNIMSVAYIVNVFMPVKGRDADGDGVVLTNDPRVMAMGTPWYNMTNLVDTTNVKSGKDKVIQKNLTLAIGIAIVRSANSAKIGQYDVSAREVLAVAPEIMTDENRGLVADLIQMSISATKKVIDTADYLRKEMQWSLLIRDLRKDNRIGGDSTNPVRMAQEVKSLMRDYNLSAQEVVDARKDLRIKSRARASEETILKAQERLQDAVTAYDESVVVLRKHFSVMLNDPQTRDAAEAAIVRLDAADILRNSVEENPVGKIRQAVSRIMSQGMLETSPAFEQVMDIIGEMVNVWKGAEHASSSSDEGEDNSSAPALYDYTAAADLLKAMFTAGCQTHGINLMLAGLMARRGASDRFITASIMDSEILAYIKSEARLRDMIIVPVLQKHVPKNGTVLNKEQIIALGLPFGIASALNETSSYKLVGVNEVEGAFSKLGRVRTVKHVLRLIEA